jgi:hypothetical protein
MTFSRAPLSSTRTENAWLHKTKLEKCDVIKRCIVKSHKVSFRETNVGTLYRCKMSDKLWNYGWEVHNNKLYLLNVNLDFGVHQSSFEKSLSSYIASNEVYVLLYCTCKNAQVVTNLQQTCGSAVPTTCQQDVFALLVPRGETWGGVGGCDTPQSTNHLDWQGKSSGLAGQWNILNDRM